MAISRKNSIHFAGLLHMKRKLIAPCANGALYLRRSSLDSICVSEPPSRQDACPPEIVLDIVQKRIVQE
jgi:hypothetical protein